MGYVREKTGIDLTGGGATDAAKDAARIQSKAGREAIDIIRGDLAPFTELGGEAANLLSSFLAQPQGVDPQSIINNPFFQALSQEQDRNTLAQRAALGLSGSGGTQDAMARQQLLLGNQFQQQELSNQQNRFNQLFGTTQLGANAAIGQASQVGNLLTDVAAVRGVGDQAKAQQQGLLGGQLLQGIGTVAGSMIGGPAGGYLGGNLFGGSTVNQGTATGFNNFNF